MEKQDIQMQKQIDAMKKQIDQLKNRDIETQNHIVALGKQIDQLKNRDIETQNHTVALGKRIDQFIMTIKDATNNHAEVLESMLTRVNVIPKLMDSLKENIQRTDEIFTILKILFEIDESKIHNSSTDQTL